MKLQRLKAKTNGVYVVFTDRPRRRKSECLTVDGLTPKQALLKFARFLRQERRKAG